MATNPGAEQAHLDGIEMDCKLSLLGAATKIDTETAPQIGDSVRITITGKITESGQKVTADKPHPFVKCAVDTMACTIIDKLR